MGDLPYLGVATRVNRDWCSVRAGEEVLGAHKQLGANDVIISGHHGFDLYVTCLIHMCDMTYSYV